jgi:CTP:molybdopterin cytidylyltransferase MocA
VIAGIILAAGASRRMGTPKALLDFHGETFVERLIRIVSRVASPTIVAVGYHADAIQARVHASVTWAVNPDPERGQLSSLQTALALVPAAAPGFLFIPVDCPAVKPSTVERVARAFVDRDASTLLVIPRCGDRRGHPVVAARPLLEEFLALDPTAQAREVVHRHIPRTKYIDVDDAGILSDIDDPESYRQLMESEG